MLSYCWQTQCAKLDCTVQRSLDGGKVAQGKMAWPLTTAKPAVTAAAATRDKLLGRALATTCCCWKESRINVQGARPEYCSLPQPDSLRPVKACHPSTIFQSPGIRSFGCLASLLTAADLWSSLSNCVAQPSSHDRRHTATCKRTKPSTHIHMFVLTARLARLSAACLCRLHSLEPSSRLAITPPHPSKPSHALKRIGCS